MKNRPCDGMNVENRTWAETEKILVKVFMDTGIEKSEAKARAAIAVKKAEEKRMKRST